MESLVVYDSQYGNTKQVAHAIADGLRPHGPVRLLALDKVLPHDLGTVDLLFVGGPTQAHGISARIRLFLDALEARSAKGTVAAAFDTRYRMPTLISGSAAKTIARRLQRAGLRIFAPPASFFVSRQGRELRQGEAERAQVWAKSVADALVLSHWCAA
ncbi:MAG TPA: flavodoxin domain-containing protein [Candidatus Dormibacteraeota bacterium]